MGCLSHVTCAFYVALFLFAGYVWATVPSTILDHIGSVKVFRHVIKSKQITMHEFLHGFLLSSLTVERRKCKTYACIYYIRYSWHIQFHFTVSDIPGTENIWHFRHRHRNWSHVANWRTSGSGRVADPAIILDVVWTNSGLGFATDF